MSFLSVTFAGALHIVLADLQEGKRRSLVATTSTRCCPGILLPMDIEMRHLRALLALAEELNFTRAAERLHLTQQALSGQIRQLEERVGTQLVHRDSHSVQLTRAGHTLLEHARPLLAGAEHAILATRAAGAELAQLTVGYVAPFTRRLVTPAFDTFYETHPETEVTIHFAGFLDPLGGLRGGPADVAILYGEFEHDGIELRLVFSEPRGIALAADHPLATRSEITIEDLVAEPLVEVPVRDRIWSDFWTAAPYRNGVPPRIGASVTTLDSLMEAIGAGLGVATTVAPAIDMLGSTAGVVFRPVPALSPLDFWVARREQDDRPQVIGFLEATTAALRSSTDEMTASGE
jgi:DNA-binding transcriptional LysR family regulator